MNIAIRYHSRGGNTKKVAEAIAEIVGVNAEPIDVPVTGIIDILFVGGGVYGHTIDTELKDFLSQLDSQKVKSLAVFSTAGAMDGTKKMLPILESLDIPTHSKKLVFKFGMKNHAIFVKNGSIKLNNKQIKLIKSFVDTIMK